MQIDMLHLILPCLGTKLETSLTTMLTMTLIKTTGQLACAESGSHSRVTLAQHVEMA